MEGVTPADGLRTENDDLFLGVDLTEYYDGDDFPSASAVVVSQLKYSTRHPDRAWTASRLRALGRQTTGRLARASLIRRLADVYRGFQQRAPRDAVIRKLRLQLVSNQPLDGEFATTLGAAQGYLRRVGSDTGVPTATLLQALDPAQQQALSSLRKASGLGSHDFTDFLRTLDLSHCGELSRAFQRMQLIQELGRMVTSNPVARLRALCELIAAEASPERVGSLGLAASDILAALEVRHPDDLFPAPPQIERTDSIIETADVTLLARRLSAGPAARVLTHGVAGTGKTTTLQLLQSQLPSGSVVITYDCFGGGSWLDPGEQRHTQRRAYMQITNELAIRCDTPFLLQPAYDAADIQREFRRSIDAAAKIVEQSPGALLVIAIDAADNAVIAAREFKEECFVPTLWRIQVPANCRLLMTARSHRRSTLDAPESVVEHELLGFDQHASAAFLKSHFPDADEQQCSVFHSATTGSPRVEAYLLSQLEAIGDPTAALETLRTTPRITLDGLFDDMWDSAVTYTANQHDARQQLALILCLPRPTSISTFAEVQGVERSAAVDFCRALMPGVVVTGEIVSFRDEDFEVYLREKLSDEQIRSAHQRLGSFFITRADQDAYAARHLVDHVFAAGQYNDVVDIVLAHSAPSVIADSLLRLQVMQRRLTLAIRAAEAVSREEDLVRLVLLAAEAAQSDQAVTALVRENPDLAAWYGDADSVARLYMREEHSSWLGSAHLRAAAVLARDVGGHDRARDHFAAAEAWIRRWVSLPRHERYAWSLDSIDIARGAEAAYWLAGTAEAVAWLRRWGPARVLLNATREFVASLARQLTDEQIAAELSFLTAGQGRLNVSGWLAAAILAQIWLVGRVAPRDLVSATMATLLRAIERGTERRYRQEDWVVPFCELSAELGIDSEAITAVLGRWGPHMPTHAPYDRDDLSSFDLPLRRGCPQVV